MATLKIGQKLFINSFKLNHLRPLVNNIHSSAVRYGDDIDKALQVKEATQVENKAVIRRQEWEQKQRLGAGLITITEPDDITAVSGVPLEHIKGRRVKIAQTVKNAMQSGTDNVGIWQLSFETRERWENPLMGWSSTGDPLSNMAVEFRSEDSAIAFAEKNGWEWFLEAPKQPTPKVKSYGFNFSWDKRNRVSTK